MPESLAQNWYLIAALLLLTVGGLMLAVSYGDLDRRLSDVELKLPEVRDLAEVATEESLAATEAARRAHLRLDTDDRRIKALAEELGWIDDHAHTKTLTGPMPFGALRSSPPPSEPPVAPSPFDLPEPTKAKE